MARTAEYSGLRIMRVNGKRAIGIGISTDPERDVVKTGDKVKERLSQL